MITPPPSLRIPETTQKLFTRVETKRSWDVHQTGHIDKKTLLKISGIYLTISLPFEKGERLLIELKWSIFFTHADCSKIRTLNRNLSATLLYLFIGVEIFKQVP